MPTPPVTAALLDAARSLRAGQPFTIDGGALSHALAAAPPAVRAELAALLERLATAPPVAPGGPPSPQEGPGGGPHG